MMEHVFEYVRFTADAAANKALLRQGLDNPEATPDWVGAVPKGYNLSLLKSALPRDILESGAHLSTGVIYPDGSANVFVKDNPAAPAIGFVKVRWY